MHACPRPALRTRAPAGRIPARCAGIRAPGGDRPVREVHLKIRLAIAAAAFLLGARAPAAASELPEPAVGLVQWLESGPGASGFVPVLQGDGTQSADEYFVTPLRGRPHLRPIRIATDTFFDRYRVGVDSGLLYPLAALAAEFKAGWWARVYGQTGADLGYSLFRTSLELGLGIGQSQSSHEDQTYRITSNYTFLSLRAVADFLPESPTDLVLFAGLGAGLEFARGHVILPTGTIQQKRRVNFNPLFEAGAGLGLELTPGFCLHGRITGTHPIGSGNILLFLELEIGVEFLFL
jgi:hypothetical protein